MTTRPVRHGWRIGRRWIDPRSSRSPRWAVIVAGELVVAVYGIERWEPTPLPGPGRCRPAPREPPPSPARSTYRHSFIGERDHELEAAVRGEERGGLPGAGPRDGHGPPTRARDRDRARDREWCEPPRVSDAQSQVTYVWCGPHWVNPGRLTRYRNPRAWSGSLTDHGSPDDPTTGRTGRATRAGPERRLPPGGGEAPRQGQDDGPGADRLPPRRRLVPGARHAGPAPGPRHGPRGEPALHRRGDHRLRHHRGPSGLRVQPGLHRLRRGPGRGVRREDPQGHGPGQLHRGADDRPQRRGRRPHPGGCGLAPLLRRHLPPQRPGLGGDPADQRDPRAVRRGCGLQPGHDRLHLHGPGDQPHVHHRARRGEDGDRRGRDPGGAGRGHEPRHQVRGGRLRGPRREGLPRRRPLPAELPPLQQPGGGPAGRLGGRSRAAHPRAHRPHAGVAQPALRHEEGHRGGGRRR